MPFGDGTGPMGSGRGGGRGGRRRGNAGPGGNCVCPNCGEKVVHQVGVPCNSLVCSKCGTRLMRE